MARGQTSKKSLRKNRRPSPALPVEILLKIFSMTKRRGLYDLAANRTLPKLALVCKSWLFAARELLYTAVYLGNSRNASAAKKLKRTLSASPPLRSMVRSISFGTYDHEYGETKSLARIIALCAPSLRSLSFSGYNSGIELAALREAMTHAVHLQNLNISSHDQRDRECARFATIPQFFSMIQCWPELQTIKFYQYVLGPFWDEDWDFKGEGQTENWETKGSIPVTPGALPVFKSFDDRYNLSGKHLLSIAQLAPNLSTLAVYSEVLFSLSGIAALKALSPSLTKLHITTNPSTDVFDEFGEEVASLLAAAPNLRSLEMASKCMLPSAFLDAQAFPALEHLDYEIRKDTDEIHVLTDALRAQPHRAPALKELVLMTGLRAFGGFARPGSFQDGVHQALKEVCASRGVRLKEDFDSEIEREAAQCEVTVEEVRELYELKADEIYSDEETEWDEDEDEEDEDEGEDAGSEDDE
ncbi:hypothetical protein FA95DRAFT_1680199 [Auriscalpium vulgare]|uniref:Uncharacterized protein n=1 Tax=Auriscalpium vulgare TaxID=40419 RepID=A0ACB8RPC9_9AGAM|nr:hypothetical protein FA95DRAFT_1680199 [Auriscalpium vulgare]